MLGSYIPTKIRTSKTILTLPRQLMDWKQTCLSTHFNALDLQINDQRLFGVLTLGQSLALITLLYIIEQITYSGVSITKVSIMKKERKWVFFLFSGPKAHSSVHTDFVRYRYIWSHNWSYVLLRVFYGRPLM